MVENIVELRGVVKRFGQRVALDTMDLELRPAEITALVGPNGSGKTTLLKLLAGFAKPTSGTLRVFGLDPYRRREVVMTGARFAFAPPALYENLTARETLTMLSGIGLRRGERSSRQGIDDALRKVGLLDRADDRVRVFSFGMRQRLALALALLPVPRLLVLDEPTEGLDPLGVLELRDTLTRLRDVDGVTILLSSHLLVEVERLADQLVLLFEGKTVFRGPPAELIHGSRLLRLAVFGDGEVVARTITAFESAGIVARRDGAGCVHLPSGSITLNGARQLLRNHDVELREFHERAPSLEEALLERLRRAGEGKEGLGTTCAPVESESGLSVHHFATADDPIDTGPASSIRSDSPDRPSNREQG